MNKANYVVVFSYICPQLARSFSEVKQARLPITSLYRNADVEQELEHINNH